MSHDELPAPKTQDELKAEEAAATAEFNSKLKPPYITMHQRLTRNGVLVKEYMALPCDPVNPRKTIETAAAPGFDNKAKIALKRFGKARTDMVGGYYFEFVLVTK